MRLSCSATGRRRLITFCVGLVPLFGAGFAHAGTDAAKVDPVAVGYEIFHREWLPNDTRAHGGDGLGPVYNDTSCVACHNSGGSGGAGPFSKNIDILNASRNLGAAPAEVKAAPSDPAAAKAESLTDFHAAFRTGRTAVLHKFGTDPNYESWRNKVGLPTANSLAPLALGDRALSEVSPNQLVKSPASVRIEEIRAAVLASNPGLRRAGFPVGLALVTRSQRNPTPLFGLGMIDAIPDDAIVAVARRQTKETPDIQGRVSRLKDGRIGRLGWKGQTANVEDFVLNACAVELGLEVPGHPQAVVPQAPRYQSSGTDLTTDECSALTAYVRSLAPPVERAPSSPHEKDALAAGKTAFAAVGCAACHVPKLGKVDGLYSDLLLHDMGDDLGDDGSYSDDGSDDPIGPEDSPLARADETATRRPRGASRLEWRTPPLWGFRDSGPYLHDGRAQSLDQAVALHGGQGAASALKFFELSPRERLQVEAFLKSLVAPSAIKLTRHD